MEIAFVVLSLSVALLAWWVTTRLQRLDRRVSVLESEVGLPHAEDRIERPLLQRVMALEMLDDLRRPPRSQPRTSVHGRG